MKNLMTSVLLCVAAVELAGCRFICQALESEGRDPQAERKMDGGCVADGTVSKVPRPPRSRSDMLPTK